MQGTDHPSRDSTRDFGLIALLPACAVFFDYVMTLLYSQGPAEILAREFSPIVRFGVAYDLLIPSMVALMVFYTVISHLALKSLAGTPYHRFGVLIVLLVSFTHVAGGLSWVIRSPLYSTAVLAVAATGILLALAAFGTAIIRKSTTHSGAPDRVLH